MHQQGNIYYHTNKAEMFYVVDFYHPQNIKPPFVCVCILLIFRRKIIARLSVTHVTKILVIPSPPGLMYVKITKNCQKAFDQNVIIINYQIKILEIHN